MARYDVPDNLLNKLKCSLCYEYLSYPPITLYAETGSVCGRCPVLEAEKNIQPLRERSYENVASILTFPCRYKPSGCQEHLSLQQMPTHEQNCLFKPYFCPVLPLGCCAWQGSPEELYAHFATNHQMMLLEDPMFEFDMIHNYKENYLIPALEELFLLRTEFNNSDKIFRCSAHLIGKPQEAVLYEYELVFSAGPDEGSNKRWTHPKKSIETDVNLMDRTNECTVELMMLRAVLEEPTIIICKLNVSKLIENLILDDDDTNDGYDVEEILIDTGCEEISSVINTRNKLMEDIECPVCQEYMTSPIFQCVTGHSVCGVCKPHLRECPSCRGQIGNTRNFTLEKIIENFDYQCKNKDDGCKFVGNSATIRKHEVECKYKPNRCPLSDNIPCDWMGLLNKAYAHARSAHSDSIQLNALYQTIYNPNCSRFEEMKLKTDFGTYFRIRYSYCNETRQVSCTVQCLAPAEDSGKYLYEINVIDGNNTGMELKSKKRCGSWGDEKTDIKHNTMWHLDMVLPFLRTTDQQLSMRCVITKG